MVDFVWGAKGEIEVLRAASCHVFFQASYGNAPLSPYDVKESIKQAVAGEPLFLQYNQETSTVHVGYGNESSVDALFNALDQRLVTLGQSIKVKIRVRRDTAEGVVAAASREWEDDILEEGEVDTRLIQEDLFKRATPGHRPDTIVLRQLPCKWFGIASEEAGASEKLRTHIEQALVTIPTQVDAVFLPCGLLMDVYIQFGRLVEVEKAFARFQGKALRYENSTVVKPVVVQLDRSVFFADAQCRARHAVKKREAQARQALEGKRIRLGKERKEIAALLRALDRNEEEDEGEDEGEEEKEDIRGKAGIRRELVKLNMSLAEADEIDQRLIKEPRRMAAQRMIREIGELQHHCRRGVAAIEAELARLRDEAHEKQRLDEVREVRVAQARALKESDHRWRVGLEGLGLSKEARQSKLCASFIKSTEAALAEARDLVLREAHKIINLEEYFQRLQGSLKEAEKKVGNALRLLRLDGEAREVEASFKGLCASMQEAGEDALPKWRESGKGLVDTVVVEKDGGLDEVLSRFLHRPSRATTYRKALAAALLLNERRRSEDEQKDAQERVEEFALVFRELEGHFRSLQPAWELYSKLRLWQVRLKRLWQQAVHGPRVPRGKEGMKKKRVEEEGKEGKQGPVPAVVKAMEAAKVALQAAVAFLMNVSNEGDDDEEDEEEKENAVEASLFMLQQAVGDAEVAISKVKEKERMRREVLRRLAEEKALAERNRDEEMQAKAREKTMGRRQLERLERRRAHLEASLRREEARDRLEEMRAAGLLSFSEAEVSPRGRKGKSKDEMEGEEEEGVAMSVMGLEGSKAVVIAPAPIEERERWSMVKMEARPPLNLACADVLPNLVSADYWTRKRQQQAVGVESAKAGYLRSEVVVIGADGVVVAAATGKRRQSDPLKIRSPRSSSKKSSRKSPRKRGSTGSMREEGSSKKTRSVVVVAST